MDARVAPVLVKNGQGQNVVKEMRFGLIPAHYTGFASAWTASTIHARLETVATLDSFKNAWAKKRRVIFPLEHFVEKTKARADLFGTSRGMVRVAIKRADDKPFGVAGIWDYARYAAESPILSAAMLTRAPGKRMQEIHDREPVVLEPEDFEAWLGGADLDLETPWGDDAFQISRAA